MKLQRFMQDPQGSTTGEKLKILETLRDPNQNQDGIGQIQERDGSKGRILRTQDHIPEGEMIDHNQ